MPRLICKSGGDSEVFFDLRLGVNKLGRLPGNHFQVEHATVSSSHCEITWLDGGIVVRDCNSTNGTFIDDVQISEGKLQTGQVLRLGELNSFWTPLRSESRFQIREMASRSGRPLSRTVPSLAPITSKLQPPPDAVNAKGNIVPRVCMSCTGPAAKSSDSALNAAAQWNICQARVR